MSDPTQEHQNGEPDEFETDALDESMVEEQAQFSTEDPEFNSQAQTLQPDPEVALLKEALLRMRADMDNRDKRAEREMVKARKFALESLMRDLLQVLDSFDQAIAQNAEGASEGLSLTYKLALKVLAAHGLELIEPTVQPFDPNWHEAIVAQPSDQYAPDTVLEVLQKGYRLNERLIRPARVVVTKAMD